MNANIKVIRYKSKERENGKAPIAIRITKLGDRSYIFLKHFLTEHEWDEENSVVRKSHENSRRLNIKIKNRFLEAEKIILDAEDNKLDLSASQIKELIQSGGFSFISFNKLAKEHLDSKLKANKFNQHNADKSKFNAFRTFLENQGLGVSTKVDEEIIEDEIINKKKIKEETPKIDFNVKNITGILLKDYKNHLESKGQKKTSICNKLDIIRSIFNKAIAKRIIDRNAYPFGKGVGQIQIRPGEGMKVGMEVNELDSFEYVDLSENNPDVLKELKEAGKKVNNLSKQIEVLIHARNVFMFSYYFAGVRIADTLKTRWSDFKNERYYYFIGKNSRPMDVPIPEQVLPILKYYEKDKRSDDDYVFPDLKDAKQHNLQDIYKKIRTANKKINQNLALVAKIAKVEKKQSMHNSRHTFGDHAKGNIPPEVLQALYRHQHLSTTINYQKRWINRGQLDKGLMQVVNSRKKKDDNE
jgi:integrase/recombinase XerD